MSEEMHLLYLWLGGWPLTILYATALFLLIVVLLKVKKERKTDDSPPYPGPN